ncbi:MAG: GIY-YIG nuclease family protein, partial [Jaaginema sp. PMC 1078.18]|nr:GIY-YIG nuclease family protein [Jaaginema sp. PMC 1078.18]
MIQEGTIVRFNSSNVNEVPETSGIYAIYDPESALNLQVYLGRTNNLKRRLKEHLSQGSKSSKTIKMLLNMRHDLWFSYGKSSNYKGAEAAELNRYLPTGNKRLERKYLE